MTTPTRFLPRPGHRRWLAAPVVVLVAAVALFTTTAGSSTPAYRTAAATTGDVAVTLDSTAIIQPVSRADLTFPVAGSVTSLAAALGAHVTPGQTLAQLDTTALDAQVASANSQVASANAKLAADRSGQTGGGSGATGSAATGGGANAAPAAFVVGAAKGTPADPAAGGSTGAVTAAQDALLAHQHEADAALATVQRDLTTAVSTCGAMPAPTAGGSGAAGSGRGDSGDSTAGSGGSGSTGTASGTGHPGAAPNGAGSNGAGSKGTASSGTGGTGAGPDGAGSTGADAGDPGAAGQGTGGSTTDAAYRPATGGAATTTTTTTTTGACEQALRLVLTDETTAAGLLKQVAADEATLNRAIEALRSTGGGTAPGGATGGAAQGGVAPGGAAHGAVQGDAAGGGALGGAGKGGGAQAGGAAQGGQGAGRAATGGARASAPVSAEQLAADQAAVDSAQAQLVIAQQNRALATLTSPIDGTVGAVTLAVGQQVTAGAATPQIVVLSPSGGYQAQVSVGEADVSRVAVGQHATVTPDGAPTPVDGTVSAIGVLPTSSGGSGGATYQVTIALAAGSASFPAGQGAAVAIALSDVKGVLTVPTSAVHTTGTTRTVDVLRGGTSTAVPVQVGAVGAQRTQILSGLSAGDVVIVADPSQPLPSSGTAGLRGIGGGGGAAGAAAGGGATGARGRTGG